WEIAVTCALAVAILTDGWKKILTMPKVVYEFDSMCWMSLTVVVSARSNGVMMRPAIWSGGKPWYCQATPMIGILMLGKISTGLRSAASEPRREMSRAATINVYGRLSATRTIASIATLGSASEPP